MPNIIINNYCNQACSYCFANANMQDTSRQKDMSLSTFVSILKFLKKNNQTKVRILWGEPFLHKKIRSFLLLWYKWWFEILLFSNLFHSTKKLIEICNGINKLVINCNINDDDFYTPLGKKKVQKNIEALKRIWVQLILSYNIADPKKSYSFILSLLENYDWLEFNIKITNSSIWENLIIDNTQRSLWRLIFWLIQKYHKKQPIIIGCGLDKNIFSQEELDYIKRYTLIRLEFWCDGNKWKLDINTDGSFFKCYPLQSITTSKSTIQEILDKNKSLESLLENFPKGTFSKWECTGNKIIKNIY